MNIDTIIAELIELDPSFKEHESRLREIIQKLIEAKPDVQLDENFRKELKNLLLAEARDMQVSEKSSQPKLSIASYLLTFFGGATLASLVIIPSMYSSFAPENLVNTVQDGQKGKEKISIETRNQAVEENALQKDMPESFTPNSDATSSAPAPMNARGMGGGAATDMKIAPAFSNVRYQYNGENLSIDSEKLEAFTASAGNPIQNAKGILGNIRTDKVDLSQFNQVSIQNITFLEQKKNGYIVNVSSDGNISINQNYETWTDPYSSCNGDPACYQRLQLSEKDVPSDQSLISIASSFLQQYGIQTSSYDSPIVQKTWNDYPRPEGESLYIPDTITVIYPEIMNGKKVYDEAGNPVGIQVSINIRDNKVTTVWGLALKTLKATNFTAEQDMKKLVSIAEQGGIQNFGEISKDAEVIQLGTPEEIYVKVWRYENGKNSEYLVPGFLFPAMNTPEKTNFYKKNIVMPLAQEFLQQNTLQTNPVELRKGM